MKWAGLALSAVIVLPACQSKSTVAPRPMPTLSELWKPLGFSKDPTTDPAARAVVVYFTAVDCPVANSFTPEVKEIMQWSLEQGTQWVAVYPDEAITDALVNEHQKEFDCQIRFAIDPTYTIAWSAGIVATPEVMIFAQGGALVYRGRIDDGWNFIGTRRNNPTHRELRDTLTQLLDGKSVAFRQTEAIGCLLPKPPSDR